MVDTQHISIASINLNAMATPTLQNFAIAKVNVPESVTRWLSYCIRDKSWQEELATKTPA